MAAVAPCAYYGCGCGQPGHMASFFQSGGMAYPSCPPCTPQQLPVKLLLHHLLLELKPIEQKYWEAQQFGAADARPWSSSSGPSNPGEASADAVECTTSAFSECWGCASTASAEAQAFTFLENFFSYLEVFRKSEFGKDLKTGMASFCFGIFNDKPCPANWMGTSDHVLELLQLCQFSFLHGQVKNNVSWLFLQEEDVDRAAAIFRNLRWTKVSMGQESPKQCSFQTPSRVLLKYTKQNDLWKVPACIARAWLVHIWKDVPSSRPNREMAVNCVVHWLADSCEMQGQRFKPIPHMHWSQSQGFGLLKRLLSYHLDSFGFFNFIFLLAMSGVFGCFFWSCFGLPLETLKEWKLPA